MIDGALPARVDRGQATVELALVFPFLCLVFLLLVQVGLVVRAQVLVTHAAREAARAASVGADPEDARRAAEAAGPLDAGRLSVTAAPGPGAGPHPSVRVAVVYRCVTDLPVVGWAVPDVDLRAEATMLTER